MIMLSWGNTIGNRKIIKAFKWPDNVTPPNTIVIEFDTNEIRTIINCKKHTALELLNYCITSKAKNVFSRLILEQS